MILRYLSAFLLAVVAFTFLPVVLLSFEIDVKEDVYKYAYWGLVIGLLVTQMILDIIRFRRRR